MNEKYIPKTREYYQKHKEELCDKAKKRYEANKKAIIEKNKEYLKEYKKRPEYIEKQKQYYKTYYEKHKEEIIKKRMDIYYQERKLKPPKEFRERKPRIVKEKVLKPVKLKIIMKKMPDTTEGQYSGEHRINPWELTKEILLSQGKGFPTLTFQKIVWRMCLKINSKFSYTDYTKKHDIIVDSFLNAVRSYKTFNYQKYSNGFVYLSEVIKRGQAYSYNKLMNGGVTGTYYVDCKVTDFSSIISR